MKLSKHYTKWEMVRILLGFESEWHMRVEKSDEMAQILDELRMLPKGRMFCCHAASRAFLLAKWNSDPQICWLYLKGSEQTKHLDFIFSGLVGTHGGNKNYTLMFERAMQFKLQ